ncbi:MAG: formylglycine-generating enzyme family protein [bacterium]|nr:formylglycine-generating enzyme family protein [bacterium]
MHRKGRMIGFAVVTAMVLSAFGTLADGLALSVTNVVSRQRYPWNGLVDIDCEIACSDPTTNINLYLSAKDNAANKSLSVRHVWLESDATHTNALEVKAGKHRIVWDAGTDAPNVVSGDVTIDVQALVGTNYLVIDLSGGANAASYPVSYLGAEPQGGWTDEYKTDKLVLRMIQPGTFTMGSPADEVGRWSYEDQHTVTLTKPFYMGVFEVTQRQWELVMGTKPSYFSNASYYQTRPVEQVSYNQIRGSSLGAKWPASGEVDATSFIGKIRIKTGLDEFDLPTEAQWEFACRAGTTTALNSGKNLTSTSSDANMNEVGRYWYNFPSGGTSYSSSSTTSAGTAAVGSYKPNEWGLYDMHGNVWEWCLDWWTLSLSAATDPVGASSGSSRVCRGGGWYGDACDCRSACRDDDCYPSNYGGNLGFRLSRTLP